MSELNVFKVLSRSTAGLQSYCQTDLPSEYRLVYPTDGTVISPNKGFIFVFKDLPSVEKFKHESVRAWNNIEVWEATATNTKQMDFILRLSYLYGAELNDFWTRISSAEYQKNNSKIKESPVGTLICDSLKLIKKVS